MLTRQYHRRRPSAAEVDNLRQKIGGVVLDLGIPGETKRANGPKGTRNRPKPDKTRRVGVGVRQLEERAP